MSNLSTSGVHSRTLTAFFDTRAAAQKATDDLVAIGIPREHVRINEGGKTTAATSSDASTTDNKGFWDELKDLFLPDEDRYGYAEGLKRGGFLLSVKVEEAYYSRATDILDTDGAIDMDEREQTWRSSGWTGYQAGSFSGSETAAATTMGKAGSASTSPVTAEGTASLASVTTRDAASVDTLQAGRDEVIPIYQETAKVAKRDVNQGRVRLRSYVVETPISEQVSLRNEQVQVERRPVNRVVSASDAVFQDRVIEAEEHREEAFITKEARVVEEISLRKTVENQSQTISDTVRRTEVEIEDGRSKSALGVVGSETVADSQRITAHMDVIASDGTKIGTVDHLDGVDKIKLAKNTSPDGQHHYIPLTWVDHIDTHVHLNKTSTAAKAAW